MSKPYKEPILTSIFGLFGLLSIIGGIILITFGVINSIAEKPLLIAEGIGALFSGCLLMGVGQAIDFLGRTAHSAERTASILHTNVLDCIKRLDERLSSDVPFRVRVEETMRDNPSFHYAVDGAQEGPFTAGEMRDLRNSGTIAESTQVFRKGDSEWRKYKDYPELRLP